MFPHFKHFSYLKLLPIEVQLNDFSFEIEFQIASANGLIFHLHDTIHHDFIAVFIRNGFVEMRYFILELKIYSDTQTAITNSP